MVTVTALRNIYFAFCALFLAYLWWVVDRGWNPGTIAGAAAFAAVQLWFGYLFYKRRQ